MDTKILAETAKKLVAPKKGILAADESSNTIKSRFDSINVESNEAYLNLLVVSFCLMKQCVKRI
jgi:fructose-bisphosphate aldolase class I